MNADLGMGVKSVFHYVLLQTDIWLSRYSYYITHPRNNNFITESYMLTP